MTSSGPTSLAKAVKPRRSQKTTLTSVRWLFAEVFLSDVLDKLGDLRRKKPLEAR
jgi:hypothetical protein